MPSLLSRREFLQASAAGLGALASGRFAAAATSGSAGGWKEGMQINPAIDNLRVVNCFDPAMIAADPVTWDVVSQNAPVAATKVRANLDAMACALAQKATAAEAWPVIFRKPEGKAWADVKVALKPNGSGHNNTRVAVIDAVCRVLMGFGVAESNIVLYGCHKQQFSNEGLFYRPMQGNGLPAGIILSRGHDALGGTIKADVPDPCPGKFECAAALARGSVDILVNIAANKGHFISSVGALSLTMKNHAGSFEMPISKHMGGGLDYIIAFNKSEAILGGSPARQQLCIVDSLWGLKKGPPGIPSIRLSTLSMGTFSPAVDWLVAKKIREPKMGCTHPGYIERILTQFGYSRPEFENLDFVQVNPA
jgi:hypothetical protein